MKLTEIVTALENKRQTVQNAIDALNVLISLEAEPLPAIALPPPIAALPQLSENTVRLKRAPKVAKAVRKSKSSGAEKTCAKHPGNTEWDGYNGACSKCRREYQTARRLAKGAKPRVSKRERPVAEMRNATESTGNKITEIRKPTAAISASSPVRRRTPEAFTGDELEYSKAITCPKCHTLGTRFSRPEDFNRDTDFWTCLKNGCQVRIAHIVLGVDHAYEPDAA